jgi:hypothetical protein
MNEQTKQKQANHHSNAFKLEEGAQDLIARVMTIARLLATDSAAPDDPSAEQTQKGANNTRTETCSTVMPYDT